jgi:PelA/Pel-15E family pectate lyase
MNPPMRLSLILLNALCLIASPLRGDSAAEDLLKKPDEWFATNEGRDAVGNILSWQTAHGDWPKNVDTSRAKGSGKETYAAGTFDNGATTGELRVLARAHRLTNEDSYKSAFLRGFDHLLKAQYPNGGWPQYFPLSTQYHRHITFNDGTMIGVMEFLQDAVSDDDFAFLDEDRRTAAARAVDRGVDCILQCQIIIADVPAVWCAQHDAETLAPAQARTYEHPSLSGAESAGILIFLMRLEEPTPEVIRAVNAGVAWFESAKIEGYRYNRSHDEPPLTEDPAASPLWARFYEIESGRPIFSDRDGVVKYDLAGIGSERRGGYTWYGNWGESVARAYLKWPHR